MAGVCGSWRTTLIRVRKPISESLSYKGISADLRFRVRGKVQEKGRPGVLLGGGGGGGVGGGGRGGTRGVGGDGRNRVPGVAFLLLSEVGGFFFSLVGGGWLKASGGSGTALMPHDSWADSCAAWGTSLVGCELYFWLAQCKGGTRRGCRIFGRWMPGGRSPRPTRRGAARRSACGRPGVRVWRRRRWRARAR